MHALFSVIKHMKGLKYFLHFCTVFLFLIKYIVLTNIVKAKVLFCCCCCVAVVFFVCLCFFVCLFVCCVVFWGVFFN